MNAGKSGQYAYHRRHAAANQVAVPISESPTVTPEQQAALRLLGMEYLPAIIGVSPSIYILSTWEVLGYYAAEYDMQGKVKRPLGWHWSDDTEAQIARQIIEGEEHDSNRT